MTQEFIELDGLAQAARQHKHVVRVSGNLRIDAAYQKDLDRVTWAINGLSASADQVAIALQEQAERTAVRSNKGETSCLL